MEFKGQPGFKKLTTCGLKAKYTISVDIMPFFLMPMQSLIYLEALEAEIFYFFYFIFFIYFFLVSTVTYRNCFDV